MERLPGQAETSQGLEDQVVEGHQEDVVPYHQDLGLRHLPHVLDGEADYIGKVLHG